MEHGGEKTKSLSRSLGEFFGHIWKGVKTPVEGGKVVVREEAVEEVRETAQGRVIVRRTVVEEMEVRPREEKRDVE
jgi:hypothetical protein